MKSTIIVLGPSSDQCQRLVGRIEEVTRFLGREVEWVRIEDLVVMMEYNLDQVPTAIFEGEQSIRWTGDTTSEQILSDFLADSIKKKVACRCGGGCRKKREDPSHSCHKH